MRRIDSSLKPRICGDGAARVASLKQTRIDPTEPFDPDEGLDRFRGA
jgi:hypothetical protein